MRVLTAAQRKKAEKNHGLILSYIRKNRLNFEEFYGDLAETYCIAMSSHKRRKGTLSTYVFVSLDNRLKSIRRAKTYGRNIPLDLLVSLDKPVSAQEGADTLADLIPDCGADVESKAMHRLAWEQINREFSPLELELLDNIIYREHTQREFAKRYGISQTSYCRWERKVKEKAHRIFLGA